MRRKSEGDERDKELQEICATKEGLTMLYLKWVTEGGIVHFLDEEKFRRVRAFFIGTETGSHMFVERDALDWNMIHYVLERACKEEAPDAGRTDKNEQRSESPHTV